MTGWTIAIRARCGGGCARAGHAAAAPARKATKSRRLTSLGGGHAGSVGFALCLEFQEGAAVVLRRHLDEGGERVVPVFEKHPGAGAAGEEVVALDHDAQARGVEAQRVAHAAVDNVRGALARPLVVLAVVRLADRFEIDPGMVAEAGKAAPGG